MSRPTAGPRERARLPLRYAPLLVLPRFLTGFRFSDWLRLMQRNKFAVHPVFWPRAAWATAGAALTSCLARFEKQSVAGEGERDLLERPVFIIGLARSGTSHLFDLLSQSPDLCFPTRFDVFHPHTLLLMRRWGVASLLQRLPTVRRAMDDFPVGWGSAEEDILALTILTSTGERLGAIFPRNTAPSCTTNSAPTADGNEAMQIIRALKDFTAKLVRLHRKCVALKSPGHTGRVREILAVFPEARFVTIFRNPLHQLASLAAMKDSGNSFWCTLQWPEVLSMEETIQHQGRRLSTYFEARPLIPAGNLVEITYEELVADRSAAISGICRRLSIEPPANLEARASDRRRRNPRPPLPESWLPLVRKHYEPLFTAGIYPQP